MVRCSLKAIKSTSKVVIGKKKKNVVNHNGGKKNLQKVMEARRKRAKAYWKTKKECVTRRRLQRNKQEELNRHTWTAARRAVEFACEMASNCDFVCGNGGDDFMEDGEADAMIASISGKSNEQASNCMFETEQQMVDVEAVLEEHDVIQRNSDKDGYIWGTPDALADLIRIVLVRKEERKTVCSQYFPDTAFEEDLMGDFEDSEDEEEDDEEDSEDEDDDERHQSLDEFENVVYSYLDAMVKAQSVKGASRVFFQFPKDDYPKELEEAVRRFCAGEYKEKKQPKKKKKADDDEDWSMSEEEDEESSSEDEDESDAEDAYTIEVVDKSLEFHNCFHSVHHTCLHEERPELINNGYVVTLLDDQVFKKYVETLSDDIEDAYGLPINVDLYAVLKALKVKHNRKLDPYELEEQHHEYLTKTSVTVRHTINGRTATIEVTDYLEDEEEEDSKDYESMSYREVQRICKRRGFAGNETKAWMIDVLKNDDKVIAEMEDAEF